MKRTFLNAVTFSNQFETTVVPVVNEDNERWA